MFGLGTIGTFAAKLIVGVIDSALGNWFQHLKSVAEADRQRKLGYTQRELDYQKDQIHGYKKVAEIYRDGASDDINTVIDKL